MTGRVLTRSFTFETRQHTLFGIDLGEGVPRRAFLIGVLTVAIWFALLTALFGLPNGRTLTMYVTVPGIIVWFGFQPSTRIARHRRITDWMLKIRYVLVGHTGLVNGANARRRDLLRLRDRLPLERLVHLITPVDPDWDPWTVHQTDTSACDHAGEIALVQTATIAGPTTMTTLRERYPHG